MMLVTSHSAIITSAEAAVPKNVSQRPESCRPGRQLEESRQRDIGEGGNRAAKKNCLFRFMGLTWT